MILRWRQHEILLATLLVSIGLVGFFWRVYSLSAQEIEASYALTFRQNGVPFGLYRNLLLPTTGLVLLVYLSYLWVNLYFIPRVLLKGPARAWPKGFLTIGVLVFLFILNVAGITTAGYFLDECYFHYPGFQFFPPPGNHSNAQWDVYGSVRVVFEVLLIYGLYACVRELITWFIKKAGAKMTYQIWVINQVSLFLVLFLAVPMFVPAFGLVEAWRFFGFYFAYLLPLIIVFLNNVYWLFPLKGEGAFFSSRILWRLLLTTFLYTVPFVVILSQPAALLPVLLGCWSIQLFVVTPISWRVYRQVKDKILQWRGVGQVLAKSKADLQFLRSQINPHFLFNTLNTLYGTALQEEAPRTAEGIQKLGDMMRFLLHENTHVFIRLEQEIAYLKNYISLQKLRTQSSPDISIEDHIGEGFGDHRIAPMLLIPFVENAFKHGISLREKSWIVLSLTTDKKTIRFQVSNSIHARMGNHRKSDPKSDPKGNQKNDLKNNPKNDAENNQENNPKNDWENDPERERSGIGLKNVHERLKLIYAGKHELDIQEDRKEYRVKLVIFIS